MTASPRPAAPPPAWLGDGPVVGRGVRGRFLEACDCEVLCPCWVGQPPDQNVCNGMFAWDVEGGILRGSGQTVELAGVRVVSVSHHEGLRGTSGVQRVAIFVDDSHRQNGRLSDAELQLLVRVFLGRGGGALAGLGALLGTVVNLGGSTDGVRADVLRRIDIEPSGHTIADVLVHAAESTVRSPEARLSGSSPIPSEDGGAPITVFPSSLSRALGAAAVSRADRLEIFTRDLVDGGWLDLDLHGRSSTVGRFRYADWG